MTFWEEFTVIFQGTVSKVNIQKLLALKFFTLFLSLPNFF